MTVFTCEHEFEAMMTCIYRAWQSRLGHNNIRLELEPVGQYSMFDEYIHVDSDSVLAEKVINSVITKISPYYYQQIMYSAHYYENDVLDNIYRMLILGFQFGNKSLDMLQYEVVNRSMAIRRAYGNEVCRFKEIARFHLVKDSLYVSHIEPHSRIVVALGPVFHDRMPSENWMIVDDLHLEAVIHPKNSQFYIRKITSDELDHLIETENNNDEYTDLWKAFFDSIAIKERENPVCQRNHLPYWARKHVVEFN